MSRLSNRNIFRFWAPLAATWLMMAAEGPFLAAVIARLADRAAERGDAIGVALRLRETAPHHPTTAHFVEKLFGAVLERSVPAH